MCFRPSYILKYSPWFGSVGIVLSYILIIHSSYFCFSGHCSSLLCSEYVSVLTDLHLVLYIVVCAQRIFVELNAAKLGETGSSCNFVSIIGNS